MSRVPDPEPAGRAMPLLLRHRLSVRFRDCDPLGHVNNAVYLTYLEQARFNLWREQLGYIATSASAGGARGLGFILARVECDFTAQARYGDELEVRLSLAGLGRSSFTYAYEIVEVVSGRRVALAKTVIVRFDYDSQASVPLDESLRQRLATPTASALAPLDSL
jgi:acyl-CoA thioester hydrolase